jgi:hypothetical protein
MNLGTLIIFGLAIAALGVGGFFLLVILALLGYVGKTYYPVMRRVGYWAARLENFLPLLVLAVVLVVLIILIAVVATKLPTIVALLLILLLLIILVVLVVVDIPLLLGILVYVIRAARWLYGRWKGLLGGLLPQIMRLKIKHDVAKDTDKDWTTHFAEMRKRLSDDAEEARRRILGRDK